MYSIDNIVTTSTCDKDGNLKLFSAFQMMQDCSEMWIESEPGVKTFFEESGMTQLLASRQVEIVRVPRFKERLRTVTSAFDVKPMFASATRSSMTPTATYAIRPGQWEPSSTA